MAQSREKELSSTEPEGGAMSEEEPGVVTSEAEQEGRVELSAEPGDGATSSAE